jgi:signal transduction histidine kinase
VTAIGPGIRRPRQSVRLRLTLLYIGLFLVSAACLLTITYFLVDQQLPQVTAGGSVIAVTGNGAVVSGGTGGASSCAPPPGAVLSSPAEQRDCQPLLQEVAVRVGRDTMDELLIESGIALGIMAVASVGLGWLMAGRVLSPLRTITAAARRISARSLHQRIAMTGPDDELKELGDTFDQLLGRLDASFRAQRQFVANASHELRTPLARQRTLLEVALRDSEASTESLRAACERALAAGEQQERLIAALLTLARGERGLDRFEPFDLADIAADALAARQDDAEAAELNLVAHIEPAAGAGDPGLAERLVANLVDNAIRYNMAGGRVEIGTGTREGRPYLTVTNTGPVIPPDHLGRLFRPFQRMDQARTGTGCGTGTAGAGRGTGTGCGGGAGLGLGLAIVGAIAAAHGAELRAFTRAAGGLAIEVVFPVPPPGLTADTRRDERVAMLV